MVKTYRRKKKESVLEINENRIILSNPRIQPFNEFYYESKKDILHFYYDLKIQYNANAICFTYMTDEERKKAEIEEGKMTQKNWVTIASGHVYEFGAILALPESIDNILNVDPDILGKREYFFEENDKEERSTTDYESMYEISCTGMLEEDSYLIKKVHRHFEDCYDIKTDRIGPLDREWYEVYVGIGSESRNNTMGFRCSSISKKELLVIKLWAEDFLELAEEETKTVINKMFESEDDEYDCNPKWFREHIRNQYPDVFPKWKEMWIKLYREDFIREEYWNYVKGNVIENPIFSTWDDKNKVVPLELIEKGVPDWEAYMKAIDFYQNVRRAPSNSTKRDDEI